MKNNFVLLFLAAFILTAICGIGSAYTETRLSTNTADQYNPSLYDNYITWTDTRNGGTDIYLTDMKNKIQTRVSNSGKADRSSVDYGKIVYQDSRNGNSDIYMYNISTKTETRITTNTADQVSPSVYGNRIVWEDYRNGNSEIYLIDLATKKESRLTPSISATNPSIFRDKVVWINDKEQVVLYDLTANKQTIIFDTHGSPRGLKISGNRIIFGDYDGDTFFTHMYDFSTKQEINLPFDFRQDPAFYGNNVVYSDFQNGNLDIYMVTLGSETPAAPVAAFSASPTSGTVPLKVQFTDASTNTPTTWNWNFGDSTSSTEKNPIHTYNTAGKYTVSLTAKNAAGSNTSTKSSYINVVAVVKPPVAAFSATPVSGNAPLKVQFTDSSTGSPTSWKWDFGDSTYSTEKSPAHIYSKAGTYTVKLTTSNAAGSNTVTKTSCITVKAAPSSPKVVVSYLRVGAPNETPNQEYVQITNQGTTDVKMSGWKITDKGAIHTYQFPATFTLKAKTTVTLYTGKGTNSATKLYWGKGVYVWNNEGDTAYLYDAQGKLVSTRNG